MVDLGVITNEFPQIGTEEHLEVNGNSTTLQHSVTTPKTCSCLTRTLPPGRPTTLPFECTQENVPKMKQWLVDRYASSTFNRCPHQKLPLMDGPPIKIMVDPNATPVKVNTPATVPLHWQEEAERKLEDVALGVIERVPIGEEPTWCHRMVLVRKPDGSPQRTVDLSPLNRHCLRETHHVKPPFQQARSIPPNTLKTVFDAWNGFHSIPIRECDRHLTTFITPIGRFRYKTGPQGYCSIGDGYTRRYDEIIAEVERKTKVTDDAAIWDDENEMEQHWWRAIDFQELTGRHGVIQNSDKFQFCNHEIEFAGFKITNSTVEPLPKFLDAIQKFPRPKSITDIRSWFGLVNQCSHYGQLSTMMEPFKHLLSPKTLFKWTDELEAIFIESKKQIIMAIKEGVEIFDPSHPTCLRPDYSKKGIGFYLGQKHCSCEKITPYSCPNGWRITLAGSRFLNKAEERYAPVEGEGLAVAWALEQTRYFTQGCNNLLVATDHCPLVKLFGDRLLDEITNTRLFRLTQRTLNWQFRVMYVPGKSQIFADATSRHPTSLPEPDEPDMNEILAGIRIQDIDSDMESMIVVASQVDVKKVKTISWDRVKENTRIDPIMSSLSQTILHGFPLLKNQLDQSLQDFWEYRESLYIVDGVIMYKDRVIIPPDLRDETLRALHSAHQGTSAMMSRAQGSVFWPNITGDLAKVRNNCRCCERNAPSLPKLPPTQPHIPTTPFEAIAADYFHLKGHYYLVIADRLSGWTEVKQVRRSSATSGAKGLCMALRSLFVTFGCPCEISSDGGPEFVAHETADFLHRWGVKHRLSSAYHPKSNGRAELAVKSTKRLLQDNIGPDGKINTDKAAQALLMKRNTPDTDCKLSPAEIMFGRKLRDTLPYRNLQCSPMIFENETIDARWRETWSLKEEALKQRYMKQLERLDRGSHLPPPLRHGDRVWVQNQSGRYATKWDKSGVIVETHPNDQYTIKIDGSGRLTLRNRQFLRKIISHNLFNSGKHNSPTSPSLYPGVPPTSPPLYPGVPPTSPTLHPGVPSQRQTPNTSQLSNQLPIQLSDTNSHCPEPNRNQESQPVNNLCPDVHIPNVQQQGDSVGSPVRTYDDSVCGPRTYDDSIGVPV